MGMSIHKTLRYRPIRSKFQSKAGLDFHRFSDCIVANTNASKPSGERVEDQPFRIFSIIE